MDEIGQQLGVTKLEDWYRIKPSDAIKQPRGPIIRINYNWSLAEALTKLYPEHEWHEWRFNKTPNGFWSLQSNRRRFFVWLQEKLGIKTMSEWYTISKTDITTNGGNGLMTHYFRHSPVAAIMDAFPEHKWQPWKFQRVPSGFWAELQNRKIFCAHLAEVKGFTSIDDWYNVDIDDFNQHGGGSIAVAYNGRVADIVIETFPEHEWKPWLFHRAISFKRLEDHRAFMDWLSKSLGIASLADWYTLPASVIRENGGARY